MYYNIAVYLLYTGVTLSGIRYVMPKADMNAEI